MTQLRSTGPPPFDAAATLAAIRARMAVAAKAAGRDPASVTLTAASKNQPEARVAALLDAGQTQFGENRVQEAVARWSARRQGVELRLIGPLQTNKVGQALALFDVIETLDRPRLAEALARASQRAGRCPRLYVEVNTGEEPQKSGVVPSRADAFLARCRAEWSLEPEGLMCVPPLGEPPGPHFALTAKIARRNGLEALSMGMSADFETAIRFGATSVRVGTALFGAR